MRIGVPAAQQCGCGREFSGWRSLKRAPRSYQTAREGDQASVSGTVAGDELRRKTCSLGESSDHDPFATETSLPKRADNGFHFG
jgi:hypothetical protein